MKKFTLLLLLIAASDTVLGQLPFPSGGGGGGSGASNAAQLTDFQLSGAGSNTMTVTTNTSAGSSYACGRNKIYTLNVNGTVRLNASSVASASQGWVYLRCDVGAIGLDVSAGFTTANMTFTNVTLGNTAATGYPTTIGGSAIIPIAQVTAGSTANTWNSPLIAAGTFDQRTSARTSYVKQGFAMLVTDNADGSQSAAVDPTQLTVVACDPTSPNNFCSVTYPGIFNGTWTAFNTGTGSTSIVNPSAAAPVSGGFLLSTGATINSVPSISLTNNSSSSHNFFDPLSSTGTYTWSGAVTLSATTNIWWFAGLQQNGAAPGVSGGSGSVGMQGLEVDTSQGDTHYTCIYKASGGGAGARLSTGVTTDTAAHTYSVVKVDSTHIKCTVDSTSVTLTINSNETSGLQAEIALQNLTAVNVTANIGTTVRILRTGLAASGGN